MLRHWTRAIFIPVLGAALLITSCDRGREANPVGDPITGPSAPQAILGLFEPGDGTVEGTDGGEYRLVEDRLLLDLADLQVSKLIGIGGGQISLAGYTLTVPAGAVTRPTLFTVTVVTSGYVEVDATATITGLLGNLIDIGSRGFRKPVILSLTYARTPSFDVENPPPLVILRRVESGYDDPYELVPSVTDLERKLVHARLDHLSRYCMAQN